jgi:hypothetical protein
VRPDELSNKTIPIGPEVSSGESLLLELKFGREESKQELQLFLTPTPNTAQEDESRLYPNRAVEELRGRSRRRHCTTHTFTAKGRTLR